MKYISALLLFLFAMLTAPLQAQTANNWVQFYIDPAIAATASIATIRANLVKYVEDLNFILAKNTGRKFDFNPATGVIVTSTQPFDGIVPAGGAPQVGYQIRIWVQKSNVDASTGGFHSIHSNGDAVIKDLYWNKFYSPSALTSLQVVDYARQLRTLLRPFGNICGLSRETGNYWNLADAINPTGYPSSVLPDMHAFNDWAVPIFNPTDTYWGTKGDYAGEPMFALPFPAADRAAIRATYVFSTLSAKVIRSNYRWPTSNPPMASTTGLQVTVIDAESCLPLTVAQVYLDRTGPFQTPGIIFPLPVRTGPGTYTFDWQPLGGGVGVFLDPIRVVEVTSPGYTSEFFYLTGIDLLSSGVYGSPNWTREVYLHRPNLRISIAPNRAVTVSKLCLGLTWELQSSEDLVNWTTIFANTQTTTSSTMNFPHPTGAPERLFYRTRIPTACPVVASLSAPEQSATTTTSAKTASTTTSTTSTTTSTPTTKKIELPPLPKPAKLRKN